MGWVRLVLVAGSCREVNDVCGFATFVEGEAGFEQMASELRCVLARAHSVFGYRISPGLALTLADD